MPKLNANEIKKIKQAQDEADRQKFAKATPEELRLAWDARLKLYRELWPEMPKPGTQEWKDWRCAQTKICPNDQ